MQLIQTDEEYEKAVIAANDLLTRENLTLQQEEHLDALIAAISAYPATVVPDPPTQEFGIRGAISVPLDVDHDELFNRFITWIESQGFAFDGGINYKPYSEEE